MDWPALGQTRHGVSVTGLRLSMCRRRLPVWRLDLSESGLTTDISTLTSLLALFVLTLAFFLRFPGPVLGHVDHPNFRDGDDHVRRDGDRGHALEAAQRCSGLHYQHRTLDQNGLPCKVIFS